MAVLEGRRVEDGIGEGPTELVSVGEVEVSETESFLGRRLGRHQGLTWIR